MCLSNFHLPNVNSSQSIKWWSLWWYALNPGESPSPTDKHPFCSYSLKSKKNLCGYKELQTYVILSNLWLAGRNSLQRGGKRIHLAFLLPYWGKENEKSWEIKDSFKIYMYLVVQEWTSQMFYLKLYIFPFLIIVWKKLWCPKIRIREPPTT